MFLIFFSLHRLHVYCRLGLKFDNRQAAKVIASTPDSHFSLHAVLDVLLPDPIS